MVLAAAMAHILAQVGMTLAFVMVLFAPAVGAQDGGGSVSLTIVASDDCTEGTFCFEVTSGSLDDIDAGSEATVTFRNEGGTEHNLYVARQSDAASDHTNTPASAAIANSSDLQSGEEETVTFTVPSDASGLYFWCDVAGHESLGMWLETSFDEPAGGDGPVPVWVALLALVVAVGAWGRSRR